MTAFDPTKLVPAGQQQNTQPQQSASNGFDASRLVPAKDKLAEAVAYDPQGVWETAWQEGKLNFIDFFMPDEVMRIIRTGQVLGRAPVGPLDMRSFTEPEEVAKDREAMATMFGMDYLGVENLPNATQRATATAFGMLGDPTTFIGGGAKVPQLIGTGAASIAPTFVGTLAGESASEMAAEAGASEFMQMGANIVGNVLGGGTTGVVQAPLAYGFKKAGSTAVAAKNMYTNKEKTTKTLASTQVEMIKRDALASQPDLLKQLETAQMMAERLGKPNLKIAQMARLAANDHFNRDFNDFYVNNDDFRVLVKGAVNEFNELAVEYNKQFGGNTPAQQRKVEKAVAAEQKRIEDAKKAQQKKYTDSILSLEDRISEQSAKIYAEGDTVEAGVKLKNLQEAQFSLAKQNMSNQYDSILADGKSNGVHLPATSVRAIYAINTATQMEELFGKGNVVSSKINRYFAPRIEKNEAGQTIRIYDPVGIEQMDSLKRAINGMLSDNLTYSQYKVLNAVKQELDGQVALHHPEFAAQYKAADRAYWENVGVPFNADGVAAISRAKFAKDISAKIMNPQIAQQYLAAAGEEGPEVLSHAIRVQLSDRMFKNGVFQPAAFDNWMKKSSNRALLDLVPDLRDEFKNTRNDVDGFIDQIAEVEGKRLALNHAQTDDLFKSMNSSTSKVVSEMFNSHDKRKRYMTSLESLSPENRAIITDGIRAEMIDRAMAHANTSGKSMMDFIKDPRNRAAYLSMFGKNYVRDLEALAYIGDSISDLRLDELPMGKTRHGREFGQETIGITPSSATALARRPIVGRFQKVVMALSLVTTKQVANVRDEDLMALLSNPQLMSDLKDAFDVKDGVVVFKKGASELMSTVAFTASRGSYFSIRAGGEETQEEENR